MAEEARGVRVWDALVRVVHWALVAAFVAAYFSHGGYLRVHRLAGYAISALVVVRMVWGFVGSPHARFADFVAGPRKLGTYLTLLVRGREPRHIGHNPAGGAMIVLLLVLLAAVCVTGVVLDTPWYRDDADFKQVHDLLTDATVVCILLHVMGVAVMSWRHRENLTVAMISGRKRPPAHRSSRG
ncbi:MAG TPA: cytochrome b/b6 domain-containing protein [Usitatibacter sp.]|nr:cytochrome b/b6 domain-containing protein [Usitatibacter sp.]